MYLLRAFMSLVSCVDLHILTEWKTEGALSLLGGEGMWRIRQITDITLLIQGRPDHTN